MDTAQKQYQATRLAGYEKVSGIVWIIIAIFQILSVVLIIAGIWNIFAAISRFNMEKKILNRDADVPSLYENVTELIIIAVVNLLLGGVLGVAWVGFDLWVRSEIMNYKEIFDNTDGVNMQNVNPVQITAASMSSYEQLEKLYELKQKGILTEEEYLKEKARLI